MRPFQWEKTTHLLGMQEGASKKVTALGAFAAKKNARGGSSYNKNVDARQALSPLAAFAAARPVSNQPTSGKPGSSTPLAATTNVNAESNREPSLSSDAMRESGVSTTQVVGEGCEVDAAHEKPGIKSRQPASRAMAPIMGSTRTDSAQTSGSNGKANGMAANSNELDFMDGSSDDEEEHKIDEGGVIDLETDGVDQTDDLYEDGSNVAGGSAQVTQRSQPILSSVRLPKTSEIELFHAVLVRDTDRLEAILQERSPGEVLGIRDSDQRTLYHYGALCPDHGIQRVVFGHVDSYNERRMANQIGKIMQEKGVVDKWLSNCDVGKREWEPPGVKELTQKFIKMKQRDWEMICRCVDCEKRSILHYAAAALGHAAYEQDPHFTEAIRAKSDIICARDIEAKMPLHVAVEASNIHAIKWYFSLGICINQEDVSSLLRLSHQKLVRDVLLRQLERLDTRAYHARHQEGIGYDGKCGWNLGLGILARAELELVQGGPPDGHAASFLLDAAKYGNLNAVKLLLRQGANPRVCDSNGWTALHVCADEGTKNHIEIAKLLLNLPHSLPVDSKSLKGRTSLHLAVKSRRFGVDASGDSSCGEMISTLCGYGANADARDRKGNTPLHLACRSNNVGAFASLITAGCNVAAVDNNGRNCLHVAALRGNIEAVNFLISWEEGAGYLSNAGDNRGRKPIEVAQNEQTRQLLNNKWSLCYRGNVEGVKLHLARSRKVTRPADASLEHAFVSDRTAQTMRTPLHLAIQGYFDSLQSSNSSKHQRSSHPASHQGELSRGRYLQVVSLLLRAGADPCVADKWGVTAVMIAAAVDEQLLEALLENLPSARRLQDGDQDGNTALHYSYAFCNANNSSILEDAMDEEEIANNLGRTPLEMTGYHNRIFPEGYRRHRRDSQRNASKQP